MKIDTDLSPPATRNWAGIGIGVAAVAGLLAAIAGWLTHGTTILLTYAQDGLAWCF